PRARRECCLRSSQRPHWCPRLSAAAAVVRFDLMLLTAVSSRACQRREVEEHPGGAAEGNGGGGGSRRAPGRSGVEERQQQQPRQHRRRRLPNLNSQKWSDDAGRCVNSECAEAPVTLRIEQTGGSVLASAIFPCCSHTRARTPQGAARKQEG
ncbi:unnamed protein product, partial [Ectocarpus sp. 12 AP-2014]